MKKQLGQTIGGGLRVVTTQQFAMENVGPYQAMYVWTILAETAL